MLITLDMVMLNLLEMNANVSLLFPDNVDYFFLAVLVTQIYTLVSGTYGFQFKTQSAVTTPKSSWNMKRGPDPLTVMNLSESDETETSE